LKNRFVVFHLFQFGLVTNGHMLAESYVIKTACKNGLETHRQNALD
jgi:hypothetical protein